MIEKEDLAGVLQHACRNGDFAEIYMEKDVRAKNCPRQSDLQVSDFWLPTSAFNGGGV
jgi:hypothetical protein